MEELAMLLKKSAVRDATELAIRADFYEELNAMVHGLIERATERAKANGRKTLKVQDA